MLHIIMKLTDWMVSKLLYVTCWFPISCRGRLPAVYVLFLARNLAFVHLLVCSRLPLRRPAIIQSQGPARCFQF